MGHKVYPQKKKKILNIALKSILEINLLHFVHCFKFIFREHCSNTLLHHTSVSMQAYAAQEPFILQSRRPSTNVAGQTTNANQTKGDRKCLLLLLPAIEIRKHIRPDIYYEFKCITKIINIIIMTIFWMEFPILSMSFAFLNKIKVIPCDDEWEY